MKKVIVRKQELDNSQIIEISLRGLVQPDSSLATISLDEIEKLLHAARRELCGLTRSVENTEEDLNLEVFYARRTVVQPGILHKSVLAYGDFTAILGAKIEENIVVVGNRRKYPSDYLDEVENVSYARETVRATQSRLLLEAGTFGGIKGAGYFVSQGGFIVEEERQMSADTTQCFEVLDGSGADLSRCHIHAQTSHSIVSIRAHAVAGKVQFSRPDDQVTVLEPGEGYIGIFCTKSSRTGRSQNTALGDRQPEVQEDKEVDVIYDERIYEEPTAYARFCRLVNLSTE